MRVLEEALTFDDVLLVPAYSEILPREVDLSTRVTRGIRLNVPLLSAAMDTVTEARLSIAIAQEGGIGVIHKSMGIEAQAREVGRVKKFESGVIRDPITVSPDMSIREVLDLTRSRGISGVPVVVGRKAVGIVTHRDLRFEDRFEAPVSTVMTPKERLVTVREDAPEEEVLALLHKHRIEKLLVVNGAHELVGMITVKDFQKAHEFPRACKDGSGRLRVGAAVGTTPDTLDRVAALREAGVDLVVVDTAHGHSKGVLDTGRRIRARWAELQVVAGNAGTADAARGPDRRPVRGYRGIPRRSRALPGRLLQVLPGDGLARGNGRAPRLGGPLLPGRRHRAREAGAGRGGRPRPLQGQRRHDPQTALGRPAGGDGLHRQSQHHRHAQPAGVRAHHHRRHPRESRARRDDHQGSAQLPGVLNSPMASVPRPAATAHSGARGGATPAGSTTGKA